MESLSSSVDSVSITTLDNDDYSTMSSWQRVGDVDCSCGRSMGCGQSFQHSGCEHDF